MTTDKERKAAERDRKKAAGLVRVEVWVKRGQVAKLREYVQKLIDGEKK